MARIRKLSYLWVRENWSKVNTFERLVALFCRQADETLSPCYLAGFVPPHLCWDVAAGRRTTVASYHTRSPRGIEHGRNRQPAGRAKPATIPRTRVLSGDSKIPAGLPRLSRLQQRGNDSRG